MQLASPLWSLHGGSAPEFGDVVERATEIGRQLEGSAQIAPAVTSLWFFNIARG
jgi:hypothetical protein